MDVKELGGRTDSNRYDSRLVAAGCALALALCNILQKKKKIRKNRQNE